MLIFIAVVFGYQINMWVKYHSLIATYYSYIKMIHILLSSNFSSYNLNLFSFAFAKN